MGQPVDRRGSGVALAIVIALASTGCDHDDESSRARRAAQLAIQPKGRVDDVRPDPPRPTASILIRGDTLYLGVANATIAPTVIGRMPGGGFDVTALAHALVALRRDPALAGRTDIELAADGASSGASYRDLAHAMEVAVKAAFTDVGIVEPEHLSWHP